MIRMIFAVILLIMAPGVVASKQVIPQRSQNPNDLSIRVAALDFEVRNIHAPLNISCGEPFLTVTVEVWNIGNLDYVPAKGGASLYCDLHNAGNNKAVLFFSRSMNQVIKAGQFQKWTISISRNQIFTQCKKNFAAAKSLEIFFCADEQGVTKDANFKNNYKESAPISTQCLGNVLFPVKR